MPSNSKSNFKSGKELYDYISQNPRQESPQKLAESVVANLSNSLEDSFFNISKYHTARKTNLTSSDHDLKSLIYHTKKAIDESRDTSEIVSGIRLAIVKTQNNGSNLSIPVTSLFKDHLKSLLHLHLKGDISNIRISQFQGGEQSSPAGGQANGITGGNDSKNPEPSPLPPGKDYFQPKTKDSKATNKFEENPDKPENGNQSKAEEIRDKIKEAVILAGEILNDEPMNAELVERLSSALDAVEALIGQEGSKDIGGTRL